MQYKFGIKRFVPSISTFHFPSELSFVSLYAVNSTRKFPEINAALICLEKNCVNVKNKNRFYPKIFAAVAIQNR